VEVPEMNFLMVDGKGMPEASATFQDAAAALYGLSYTLKFLFTDRPKPRGYVEHVVGPLEALWWMTGKAAFDTKRPQAWRWTLMIRQPEHVTARHLADAVKKLKAKKDTPLIDQVRLERMTEGPCVQLLHRGPYDAEQDTIARMATFATEHGLRMKGRHHEIYFNDPRRTAPEKIRTLLRLPVVPARRAPQG
jgi:hypothetical protein